MIEVRAISRRKRRHTRSNANITFTYHMALADCLHAYQRPPTHSMPSHSRRGVKIPVSLSRLSRVSDALKVITHTYLLNDSVAAFGIYIKIVSKNAAIGPSSTFHRRCLPPLLKNLRALEDLFLSLIRKTSHLFERQ